jgi:hypothetical protein
MKLLSTNNTKIKKGEKLGWRTYGLSLSPAGKSGKQFCPHRSAGCEFACLDTSGMGIFSNVQDARLAKSRFFIDSRNDFLAQLHKELHNAEKWSAKNNMPVAVRPNVLSDLPWHKLIDMARFPSIQFYDYTPNLDRMMQFLNGELPKNYHLTFSRKEDNQHRVHAVVAAGGNVAVVFNELPETYLDKTVINGDESDLRFLDAQGVIVGLKAKGKALKDQSGFVVQVGV